MARGERRVKGLAEQVVGPWVLPETWHWARLEDVADINPRTDFSHLDPADPVTFLGMAAVSEESGATRLTETRPASAVSKGFTRFRSGDVIFAKITPCMENGKVAIVPEVPGGIAAGSTEFHVARPHALRSEFIFRYLVRRSLREEARRNMSGSAGQLRVPTDFLRNLPIPVPPPDVERQLIERVDALFAEIDDGEAALADARAGVGTYRKALLKAAVTGELTADWRRDNPSTETGRDLLHRILADRRVRWEADPKNAKKRYIQPTIAEADDGPEGPEGWAWTTMEQVSTYVTSGSRGWAEYYRDDGPLFIRAANLNRDKLDLTDVAHVCIPDGVEGARTLVRLGDVLITITGANVTKAGVVTKDLGEAYVSQHVALVRPVPQILGEFLHLWTITHSGGRAHLDVAAYGAGKPGLNLTNILEMPVALPSELEQVEIVRLVELGLNDAEAMNFDVEAQGLRQSILSAAFRGDLL